MLIAASAACQERGSAGSSWWGYSEPQADPALQSLVEGKTLEALITAPQMPVAERTRLADQTRRFYKRQNYQPTWIGGGRPSKRYQELIKVLSAAEEHGLPAHLYRVSAEDATPEHDVRTTATFFRYFTHLTGGRLDPRTLQSVWTLRPEKPDLVDALAGAVTNNDLVGTMNRLQPPQEEYRELQKALVRYRALAAKGGWPVIPASPKVKPGQPSTVMPLLRQRLAMEGDLDAAHEKDLSTVLDANTVAAMKRFEERHRMEPDGILDPAAIQALNVPVAQRIRTIELNMERWRWLPDRMPARYLLVNVPDFRLDAVENGQPVMDIRVVVGSPDNKTPIFADEMTHVVFSPYWNVPPGIASEETIPKAASDPTFIARNNMEVVGPSGEVLDPAAVDWSSARGLRIRQRPGSGNALGGVKFVFPNHFDVYLHDTNTTTLFDRLERGLSHGCVRVEEPHKLAQYVLRDLPEWTPEAIEEAMRSGQERHVKLKAPIPVYILYKTAWVRDGRIRFLKDLYGYDANQAATLWSQTRPGHDEQLQPRR
ncbi:MAG TPA: L,D-transpeptidase family protein [Vicinamibacterales bacterium]|nr:L,D-transpeptidase family protein [Vicinamibacterales bacterium]